MNRIVIIGRLTQDPTVRYTNTGVPVASLRLASDTRFRTAQGERETVFINITAWRKTAELCGQYLAKGRQVAVDGTLRMRSYQTSQGENRTVYEIEADNVQFLDRGTGAPTEEPPGPSGEEAPPALGGGAEGGAGGEAGGGEEEDDLPF